MPVSPEVSMGEQCDQRAIAVLMLSRQVHPSDQNLSLRLNGSGPRRRSGAGLPVVPRHTRKVTTPRVRGLAPGALCVRSARGHAGTGTSGGLLLIDGARGEAHPAQRPT